MALPSFQHGVSDPIEDDIRIASHHTLVVVEGNYLLLGKSFRIDLSRPGGWTP